MKRNNFFSEYLINKSKLFLIRKKNKINKFIKMNHSITSSQGFHFSKNNNNNKYKSLNLRYQNKSSNSTRKYAQNNTVHLDNFIE